MRRFNVSSRLWFLAFLVLVSLTAWANHRQVQVTSKDAPPWTTGRRALQQGTPLQQDVPKVALMFLTRGPMPLEPVWREFMEASAMIEPINPAAIQARKPHVSRARSSRTLHAVEGNPAAAWSRSEQPIAETQNPAAVGINSMKPGPAIMTGTGSLHPASQSLLAHTASLSGQQHHEFNHTQLLHAGHTDAADIARATAAVSKPDQQAVSSTSRSWSQGQAPASQQDTSSNKRIPHQQSSPGNANGMQRADVSDMPLTLSTNASVQHPAGKQSLVIGDTVSRAGAARSLAQQSSTDSATEDVIKENAAAGASNPVGLTMAADGSDKKPLLGSRRSRPRRPLSLAGLWRSLWGAKHTPHGSYPSQQGSSAEWSWTARAQRDIIAMQHMFSVYVHCPPDFFYAPGNLFAGYEVPGRVPVTWGQWSVVEGERILLRTALRTLANQRFVLLSETCLPLGPPHVMYLQYLSEPLARINACKQDTVEDAYRRGLDRWQPAMKTAQLDRKHWRKSAQWFSLSRRHAAAVAADFHAAPLFEEHCYSYLPGRDLPIPAKVQALLEQNITVERRTCVADEHYVPTLMAMHGLDDETDCLGMMTHTSWVWPAWSPNTYANWQISHTILQPLRKGWFTEEQCDWALAARVASTHFQLRASGAALASLPHWQLKTSTFKPSQVQPYAPMHAGCSLVARKFDLGALDAVMRLAANCEAGFGWSSFCYQP
ncbi:hypothetical protein WJX74_006651 [Apatococcus lobatus]|uniref:Uncharacterized protein n=1 Tax=Apatococcus lobatus TaxID=904363 RepID=A0AAW1RER8_9CHLO